MTKKSPKIFKTIKIEERVAEMLQKRKRTHNFNNLSEVIEKMMPPDRDSVLEEFQKHSTAIMILLYEYPKYLDDDLVILDLLRAIHTHTERLILNEMGNETTELMETLMGILKKGEK